MKDVKTNGNWKSLDRHIAEMERQQLEAMNAKADIMEEYFESKRRKELSKKPLKDMSWEEIHELNELRKSDIRKATENDFMPPEEMQAEIMSVLHQCEVAASKNRPDLVSDFEKLGKLIKQSGLGQVSEPRNTEDDEEQISREEPVSVSKSWNMVEISKSDNSIIQGFASTNIIDHQNHLLPIKVLKQSLPAYLEHGTILLNHKNIPIAKIISHEFRKTPDGQHEGLWIRARLFNENIRPIQDLIRKRELRGFSISGTADLIDECDTSKCYKNIKRLQLREISLVDFPCNELSKVEV